MKRAFLVSATALLFAISGWLRASYSYTTLYGGPGAITSGSWDANYWGEVALTLSAPGGCVNTSVSWHDLMFSFYGCATYSANVQQWQCRSSCGGYETDGWVFLASVMVNIHDGSSVRLVRANNQIAIYIDNYLVFWAWGWGQAGNLPLPWDPSTLYLAGGTGLTWLGYGQQDYAAPTPVAAPSIGVSPFTNHVDLQWPATSDDANGTGVYEYAIYRNGGLVGIVPATQSLSFSDTGVVPSTTYTYTLSAIDYHFNAASTNISVSTPHIPTNPPYPSVTPDGRRVGVRPTGAYWGASGENIDVMSGNLNFTLPLLKAQGRSGWSAPFNLIYNSQNWRQDSSGTWVFGNDVGYGFGWRLLAGSITPVWNPGGITAAYFIYTDSTGAEYRLDQNSGNIWSSKESIYVWFDANTNILHFRDGSYWVFGCISAEAADSGVMYPTLMEDTSGNQVLIRYMQGANANWANSSARITEIEDVRATVYYVNNNFSQPYYHTYVFTYNNDTPRHLTSITNTISTGENYSFSYLAGQGLYSPFNNQSYGAVTELSRATVTNIGTYHQFTYASSGELSKIVLPYRGYLRYTYITQSYSSNGRSYRNIFDRFLSKDGSTEVQYELGWGTLSADVPPSVYVWDPSGHAVKYWTFSTSGASLGLAASYGGYDWPSWQGRMVNTYTWAQNATGNSYIGSTVTTADPGQTYQAQKKTNESVDTYGNVTQVVYYNWGNLSTPYRTDNFTYLNTSTYTSRYIFNRMTSSPTTTIQYDNWPPSPVSGLREWDSSTGTLGNPMTITGLRERHLSLTTQRGRR